MKAEKLNFIELLDKFNKIKIPIIQRNYAQGRENVKNIRKQFLLNIKDCFNKNLELCLDFVYGVENDEGVFVPIDGQQRLTTLFLLHWYYYVYCNNDDGIKNKLKKFTYETRESSKQFCSNLVEKFYKNKDDGCEKISEKIRNQTWFYLYWEQDPTINSMLNMLDSIEDSIGKENINPENLSNIYFYFIETKEFGTEEELYIKMNSRGKRLTTFEKFKSKLEKHIKENEEKFKHIPNFSQYFLKNIDNDWPNYFFNIFKNGEETKDLSQIDDRLMNLFITIFENYYILNKNQITEESKNIIKKFDVFYKDNELISFEDLEEWGCINSENIKNIYYILEYYKNSEEDTEDEYKDIVNKNKLLDYVTNPSGQQWYKIQIYAIYTFINKNHGKINDRKEISKILYVVRNLTENIYIDNTDKYLKMIKLVEKLVDDIVKNKETIFDVLNNLSDNYLNSIGNRDIEDLLEAECLKAQYILIDENWKNKILEIDKLSYFSGNTGFLFKFIESDKEDKYEKYCYYCKMFKAIFEEITNNEDKTDEDDANTDSRDNIDPILNDNNYYFKRALFIFGNYMYKVSTRYSFLKCNDGDKYHSWKKLFNYNKNNNEIMAAKKLMDAIIEKCKNCDYENLKDTIRYSIINLVNSEAESIGKNDTIGNYDNDKWRMYLVKYPNILREITEKNNNNLPYMYVNENNNNEIYLMCGKQTNSYNWEFYTYVLKCILQDKYNKNLQDKNLKYEPTIGRYKDKFLIYENSEKEINLKMYYDFEKDKYVLNEKEYENLDEIVTSFGNYNRRR